MTFQKLTAREYLKIDIANNFGQNLEKASWQTRLDWFHKNENQLHSLIQQAEEPALFYAGVRAYEDTLAGKPTGYMISLDATSSGLQLLAALTGDLSAARLCNVVDAGPRMDAYTAVYDEMLAMINETSKISRSMTKDAIMTSLYGSTAMPKRVFGEGALLDVFYQTMEEMAPAAWELNQAFLAMWNPDAYSHDWTLPDNFHVHVKVMNQVKETIHFLNQPFEVFTKVNMPISEGRSLGANTIHSVDGMIVREMARRCDYDPIQIINVLDVLASPGTWSYGDDLTEAHIMCQTLWDHYLDSGYLSARILDYIHPSTVHIVNRSVIGELIDSLPKKPFKVVSIHDCFRCHPNYGNDLRQQYNIQLALIAKSTLLGYLISQITGRQITVGKLHPDMEKDVINTNYALS